MSQEFSTASELNQDKLSLNRTLSGQLEALGNVLCDKGWTVSCAESCTGGGVAYAFTSVPGSSRWFNQSWVTYSNEAKQQNLGVSSETLNKHGAVSQQTVYEMAKGVQRHSLAELVVTVSGIAGPQGGSADKPVGTVWFGFLCNGESTQVKKVFAGDRETVRAQAITFAINYLIDLLTP
jgi:nicotinamide-nucleotide amidase